MGNNRSKAQNIAHPSKGPLNNNVLTDQNRDKNTPQAVRDDVNPAAYDKSALLSRHSTSHSDATGSGSEPGRASSSICDSKPPSETQSSSPPPVSANPQINSQINSHKQLGFNPTSLQSVADSLDSRQTSLALACISMWWPHEPVMAALALAMVTQKPNGTRTMGEVKSYLDWAIREIKRLIHTHPHIMTIPSNNIEAWLHSQPLLKPSLTSGQHPSDTIPTISLDVKALARVVLQAAKSGHNAQLESWPTPPPSGSAAPGKASWPPMPMSEVGMLAVHVQAQPVLRQAMQVLELTGKAKTKALNAALQDLSTIAPLTRLSTQPPPPPPPPPPRPPPTQSTLQLHEDHQAPPGCAAPSLVSAPTCPHGAALLATLRMPATPPHIMPPNAPTPTYPAGEEQHAKPWVQTQVGAQVPLLRMLHLAMTVYGGMESVEGALRCAATLQMVAYGRDGPRGMRVMEAQALSGALAMEALGWEEWCEKRGLDEPAEQVYGLLQGITGLRVTTSPSLHPATITDAVTNIVTFDSLELLQATEIILPSSAMANAPDLLRTVRLMHTSLTPTSPAPTALRLQPPIPSPGTRTSTADVGARPPAVSGYAAAVLHPAPPPPAKPSAAAGAHHNGVQPKQRAVADWPGHVFTPHSDGDDFGALFGGHSVASTSTATGPARPDSLMHTSFTTTSPAPAPVTVHVQPSISSSCIRTQTADVGARQPAVSGYTATVLRPAPPPPAASHLLKANGARLDGVQLTQPAVAGWAGDAFTTYIYAAPSVPPQPAWALPPHYPSQHDPTYGCPPPSMFHLASPPPPAHYRFA